MALMQLPELTQFLNCFLERCHQSSPKAVAVTKMIGNMPLPSEGPPSIPKSEP
jgi:hypothetical protein